MGDDVSTSIIPPPLSLNDCVVDDELDIARYFIYKRIYRRKMIQSDALNTIIHKKWKAVTNLAPLSNVDKRQKTRSVGRYKLLVRNPDGTLRKFYTVIHFGI